MSLSLLEGVLIGVGAAGVGYGCFRIGKRHERNTQFKLGLACKGQEFDEKRSTISVSEAADDGFENLEKEAAKAKTAGLKVIPWKRQDDPGKIRPMSLEEIARLDEKAEDEKKGKKAA